jgi:hypothetical protein
VRGALIVAAILGAAALVLSEASARAARPLTTAFTDDVYFESPLVQAPWVQRTLATGAQVVLLDVDWAGVAPAHPAQGFNAANPSDPGYNWSDIDYGVRAVANSGVQVALMTSIAPSWAEGPGRPAGAAPGSWRPIPRAYGQFAEAIARHYSGSTPDPEHPGAMLPRVRLWQAWTEPNLYIHLAPQWMRQAGHFVPASPLVYRSLLNAFYTGVKRADPQNTVVTAGTAPFGDPAGGMRVAPALFVRELLCLRGRALRRERCPNPAHFDVLAHHPYEVAAPTTPALNVDDVSAPDLAKLTRPVHAAVRLGVALPRRPKGLWVTEFSYDSNPPNPQAVSTDLQARWLEESFYVFWRQRVDTIVWYLIRDQAPIPDYATAFESGVYLRDGTPKPSLQAFRFPFIIEPRAGLTAWGRAPSTGTVQIQQQTAAGWTTLAKVPVTAGDVFERRLGGRGSGRFRAVDGVDNSLVWRQP